MEGDYSLRFARVLLPVWCFFATVPRTKRRASNMKTAIFFLALAATIAFSGCRAIRPDYSLFKTDHQEQVDQLWRQGFGYNNPNADRIKNGQESRALKFRRTTKHVWVGGKGYWRASNRKCVRCRFIRGCTRIVSRNLRQTSSLNVRPAQIINCDSYNGTTVP